MPWLHRVERQHRPALQSCAGHSVKSHLQAQVAPLFYLIQDHEDWVGTPTLISQLCELENALASVHSAIPSTVEDAAMTVTSLHYSPLKTPGCWGLAQNVWSPGIVQRSVRMKRSRPSLHYLANRKLTQSSSCPCRLLSLTCTVRDVTTVSSLQERKPRRVEVTCPRSFKQPGSGPGSRPWKSGSSVHTPYHYVIIFFLGL